MYDACACSTVRLQQVVPLLLLPLRKNIVSCLFRQRYQITIVAAVTLAIVITACSAAIGYTNTLKAPSTTEDRQETTQALINIIPGDGEPAWESSNIDIDTERRTNITTSTNVTDIETPTLPNGKSS